MSIANILYVAGVAAFWAILIAAARRKTIGED
jgi:hypothetical protein